MRSSRVYLGVLSILLPFVLWAMPVSVSAEEDVPNVPNVPCLFIDGQPHCLWLPFSFTPPPPPEYYSLETGDFITANDPECGWDSCQRIIFTQMNECVPDGTYVKDQSTFEDEPMDFPYDPIRLWTFEYDADLGWASFEMVTKIANEIEEPADLKLMLGCKGKGE